MDLTDQKSQFVYLLRTPNGTTAFLCPYRIFQRLNQLFSEAPSSYHLRRDFVEMEAGLKTGEGVEMLNGVFVERYPLTL